MGGWVGGWVLTNSLVYPNLSWSWVRLRLGCDKMKEVFKANQCHIVKWPTLNILKGFGNHMWKITCQRNAFFSITRGGGSTHDGKFHKKNAFLLKPSLMESLTKLEEMDKGLKRTGMTSWTTLWTGWGTCGRCPQSKSMDWVQRFTFSTENPLLKLEFLTMTSSSDQQRV